MITRRSFTLGLALLSVPSLAQAQQIRRRAMKRLFESLTSNQRRRIQRELTNAGVYSLGVDGLYGPGTEAGLIRGANFLNKRANNAGYVNLTTVDGIASYYRGIITGRYAKYIYK